MTNQPNGAPQGEADDLLSPPRYPDIQDVAPDTLTGSNGADTIPAPAPVAVEQTPLPPVAQPSVQPSAVPAPAVPPGQPLDIRPSGQDTIPAPAPVAVEQAPLGAPATAPAGQPTAPVQGPTEAAQQAAATAPEAPREFVRIGPFAAPRPPAPAPATPAAPDDPDRLTIPDLQITYAGRSDVPYGRAATAGARPFRGIVFHHSGIADSATAVAYQHNGDRERRGHFGYHFYIDRDGTITQGAPLTARTNHVKDLDHPTRRPGIDLTNSDSIGIAISGSSDNPTPAQIESARKLATALQGRFNFPASATTGHGEIQRDRQSGEGMTLTRLIRGEAAFAATAGGATAPAAVLPVVDHAARATGADPKVLMSVLNIENPRMDPKARNSIGATGLYQFLPGTWTEMLQTYGQKHGLAPDTPATDARANALMAAEYLNQNVATLRTALGRQELTPGEMYATHFLGPSGAPRMIKAAADAPNDPATRHVGPGVAERNRAIFFNGAQPRTTAEVMALLEERMRAPTSAPVRRDPTAPITAADVSAPPPVILGHRYEAGLLASMRTQQGEQARPFMDLLGDAMRTETLLGRIANAPGVPRPDPDFSIGPVLKDLTAGLPERFHDRFAYAVSSQHAQDIRSQALRDARAEEDRERAGWTGMAAQVLAGFLGPAELAAGLTSGGLASGAANLLRLGKAGHLGLQAIAGAGANVGLEAGLAAASGDNPSSSQLLFSGLTGAAFGAAFGPLARNPATEDVAAQLLRSTQAGRAELLEGTSEAALTVGGRAASAGAAANNAMGMPAILDDAVFRAIQDKDVVRGTGSSWLDRLRFSSGGQIATSPNPITRLFGGVMAIDNVGKGLNVNSRTADQRVQMLSDRWDAAWHRTVVPAYDEWATAQGLNMAQRKIGAGLEEFGTQIGLAVRQTDAALFDTLPDPVKRAATEFRRQMNERRLDLQDPRRHSGGGGRAIPGSEFLDETPGYFTRVWVDHKIQSAVRRFGWHNVEDTVAGAIKKAQGQIDDDLARKLAGTLLRSPSNRDVHLDNQLSRALSSGDATLLREALSETAFWETKDIEAVVSQLSRGRPAGRDAQMKRRVDLDEGHFADGLRTTDGGTAMLSISDLLENNAFVVMQSYNRKVAGRVALAEQRIVNPSNGETILDGITSDAELETILRRMKQWGIDNGQEATSINRDEANLRWVYDRILGRPDPAIEKLGEAARWMSVLKAFNHSRLMGMLGMAQIADIGRAAGGTGIKAFTQQMSAFRRVVDMDGKALLKHGLDREIEAMFGSGTDALRGFTRQVMEDEALARAGRTGALETMERGARALASVTNQVSGFNAINSWGQLTTGKAAAQRFADMAGKGELTASERRLVNFLGLDDTKPVTRTIGGREVTDTELGHVLRSVRDHFSTDDGALFGRKVTALNLDQWADQEARAHLEFALYRFSRSVWQENDIGALHRVMSHPMAQILLQFRRFSIVAWENQLLHGIANWDGRQAAMFGGTLLSGALVYVVQTHLQAIGRSDARDFLDSKGFGLRSTEDCQKVGFAALQRAGFSSLVPMALDTILLGTPAGPQFGARSSGQPSDVLFGNATFGLAGDAARASKGILGAFYRGEEMSQTDFRNVFRLLSLNNSMPITQGLSLMISGREAPNLGGGR